MASMRFNARVAGATMAKDSTGDEDVAITVDEVEAAVVLVADDDTKSHRLGRRTP